MSETEIKQQIPEDADGDRLDRFLAEALPQYSREYLKQLIGEGLVTVAGKVITKPAFAVSEGQEWHIHIPDTQPLQLAAEDIPLNIVFEDADLLIVNKPTGMLTHPTGREQTGTLVNALLAHCAGQLSGINGVERPGIVHRLDRDTSGLLMVAKSDQAHRELQAQIQNRTAKRIYRAIVQGIPEPTGTVHAPIARHPKNRDKMAVVWDGRTAVTHWTLLETIDTRFAMLRLQLETGRTHQIRVHMAHLGHPIFGDPLYGTGLEKKIRFDSQGQLLQAVELHLHHPITQAPLNFTIPLDAKFERAQAFLTS